MVAEAAEVLRQGYNFSVVTPNSYHYRPKPSSLRQVLSVAARVNSQLGERASFQRFVQMLEAIESSGIDERTASARAGVRGIIAGRWRESRD